MNVLTAEWLALANRITGAGVPATVDPGQLLAHLSASPAAVLLLPPDPEGRGLSKHDLNVPVVLATAGPDDHQAVERLHDALLVVLQVAGHLSGQIVRDPYDTGDTLLPAQRWTTPLRVKL